MISTPNGYKLNCKLNITTDYELFQMKRTNALNATTAEQKISLLGKKPDVNRDDRGAAAIRFVFSQEDVDVLNRIRKEHPEILIREDIQTDFDHPVTDSASRYGYYLLQSQSAEILEKYMPESK